MADPARIAALWLVISAIVAFACGGWVAARAARAGTPGALTGFLVGAVALILLVALAAPGVHRVVDLRSVAIELGLVTAPYLGPPLGEMRDPALAAATAPPGSMVSDDMRIAMASVRAAAWYAVVVLGALLGSAVLGGIAGGRASSRIGPGPRAAVVALAGVMALAALATVWLWPGIRATTLALIDMDQSAGPELGVNLTEVARHPEAMWGRAVTISGLIHRVLNPAAVLLGNDKPIVGDTVLVLGEEPLAGLVTDAGPSDGSMTVGEVAQVTGIVRPLAGIAPERLPTDLAGYEGPAVLIACAIDLDIPVAAAAGDKEFPGGSSGLDLGITIRDVLDDPERYLGQTVTVSDEIEEGLLTPHAFLLGDQKLLAVSAEPRPELFVEATAYVTGEVRRFHLAEVERELGIDLDDAQLRSYEGEPVIVVASVAVVT